MKSKNYKSYPKNFIWLPFLPKSFSFGWLDTGALTHTRITLIGRVIFNFVYNFFNVFIPAVFSKKCYFRFYFRNLTNRLQIGIFVLCLRSSMCLDPKFWKFKKKVFLKNICRLARDGFLRKMSNSEIDIGLVQQLDSARADIQFLSKNHAETLKGLHSEIKSLQQSNRELQFQLTFAKTNDELELKIKQLEMENTKYKSKMNEMVSVTVTLSHIIQRRATLKCRRTFCFASIYAFPDSPPLYFRINDHAVNHTISLFHHLL